MRKQEETRLAEVAAEKTQYLAIQAEGEIVSNLYIFFVSSPFDLSLCSCGTVPGAASIGDHCLFSNTKVGYMWSFFLSWHARVDVESRF